MKIQIAQNLFHENKCCRKLWVGWWKAYICSIYLFMSNQLILIDIHNLFSIIKSNKYHNENNFTPQIVYSVQIPF